MFIMIKYSADNKKVLECDKNANGEIIIPEGVEVISSSAFKNCYNILKISPPILSDTLIRHVTSCARWL